MQVGKPRKAARRHLVGSPADLSITQIEHCLPRCLPPSEADRLVHTNCLGQLTLDASLGVKMAEWPAQRSRVNQRVALKNQCWLLVA